MDSYTTEQLYMCENCTLVDYILDLQDELQREKEEKDFLWEKASKSITEKLQLYSENKKLKEEISDIKKELHQTEKVDEEFYKELMDNYIDEVQKLKEELKKLKV